MALPIPNEKDWHTKYPECLDYKSARKSFLGVSQSEAQKLFELNALYYQEELSYMPLIPFHFYLKAYHDYLFSDKSKGDPDGASAYLGLLKWKIEKEPEIIQGVLPDMLKMAEHISKNQLYYDADKGIYGGFEERYGAIKTLLD